MKKHESWGNKMLEHSAFGSKWNMLEHKNSLGKIWQLTVFQRLRASCLCGSSSADVMPICLNDTRALCVYCMSQEEDLQEMEDSAKKMEDQFGQFFDQVIVNDNLQEASAQLLSAVHRAQDEPQWVPAMWICSDTQP